MTAPEFGNVPTRRATREQKWYAAYRKADALYTQEDCGCLVVIMVDLPDVVKADRDLIVRESMAGRVLKRCARGALPPLNCPLHVSVQA